jgi:large subunit ribosomal protein L2
VRHHINIKKSLLSKKGALIKDSIVGFRRFRGRSSCTGRITVRHLGSGCKKKFRLVDFSNRRKASVIVSITHDPFRNSFVSLNFDMLSKSFYRILATNGVGPGSLQTCNEYHCDLKLGNRTSLRLVPTGSILHSLSLRFCSYVKFVRSAGLFFQMIQKNKKICRIRLPSGLIKEVSQDACATIGIVSNFLHRSIFLGKAGKSRLLGVRPSVRGIAMNPVDHPHGGRSNGGKPCVTPWGIPTKGKPTVIRKNGQS